MTAPIQYVFGPVPSRRLGRSLGVDLVPFKTCSHNCVYCQLGRTTVHTAERAEYVPIDEVLAQLRGKLESGDRPDSITLAGSGEPTLHLRIGEVIAAAKGMTDVPVTILTNGSLFDGPEVRAACVQADRVVPSLDAGSEEVFQRVNRPAPGLTLERHVGGLLAFREEFRGEIWLEIMVVAGMNDSDEEVDRIAALVDRLRPDRVQLNSVVRPPTEPEARAVEPARLRAIADRIGHDSEVIADYRTRHATPEVTRQREEILDTLKRRPCTVSDLAAGMGIHRNEVVKNVETLTAKGLIKPVECDGRTYYQAVEADA